VAEEGNEAGRPSGIPVMGRGLIELVLRDGLGSREVESRGLVEVEFGLWRAAGIRGEADGVGRDGGGCARWWSIEAHRSGAREIVLVEEDHGDRIVLQHILVAPSGFVTKHWRQDWVFQATERLEFVADQRWDVRPVDPARVPGSWTQCVYEVSDAPRGRTRGRLRTGASSLDIWES
jgi:hypothetical protein